MLDLSAARGSRVRGHDAPGRHASLSFPLHQHCGIGESPPAGTSRLEATKGGVRGGSMGRCQRIVRLCLTGVLAGLAAFSASAETYPSHPIKIVVGFGPASSADVLARLLARQMEQRLNQAVVVENRPGNSSMLAAEAVARSSPDGYTLFMATVANTLNPAQTSSSFNLGRDMVPVALLGVVPNLLVAHPSVPANSLKELIALAKANPDGLTFGTSGSGTASHLAAELFNSKAATKIVAVHYQGGSSQAVTDLLAGRITLMFNVAATLAPHVAAGKLKAIAE